MATHEDPDDVLFNLRALAVYLQKGGRVAWEEAEPRGRKGPDRKAERVVMLRIVSPATFDSVRWQLFRAGVGRRTTNEAPSREPR